MEFLSAMLKERNFSAKNTVRRILIYHDINRRSLRSFKEQIRYYKDNFKVVSLSYFIGYLATYKNPDMNVLCLTFDDAYRSIYENAVPVLDEYDIKPCIFVPVGFIEAESKYNYIKNNIKSEIVDDCMNWEELRKIIKKGYEVGSHSFSHVNFNSADINYEYELSQSKSELELKLGIDIKYFAFPFGNRDSFSEESLSRVREYGYLKAFSGIRKNVLNNDFLLPRTYINPKWKLNAIRGMLSGHFDN